MSLLVVSPHPDDETLGAGGTLLKNKELNQQVYWLNFTDMMTQYDFEEEQIKKRQLEIEQINNLYKFDDFINLKLKPAGLDEYNKSELISQVSNIITKIKPSTLIIPFQFDIHSDHRIVFEVMHSCSKAFRYPFIKKVMMMEILSETDFSGFHSGFVPNYFVDISNHIQEKIEAMKIYESEIKDHPFPRSELSIKSLAILRGASSFYQYAEAFILLKERA